MGKTKDGLVLLMIQIALNLSSKASAWLQKEYKIL